MMKPTRSRASLLLTALALYVTLGAILASTILGASLARAQETPPENGREGGPGIGAWAGHGVRGTVTAVSGNDITVKTEEGGTYKIETSANTRIRKEREPVKLADIHVGDMVGAAGDLDEKAKTVGAVIVIVIDKAQYEKAKADFGKTWVAGAVQSIEETKITIKRPDNVVQTILVDENTSFRRHRESITLADIKTGDNISARGALQNGTFVATVLTVGGPGGRSGGGPGSGFGGPPRGGQIPDGQQAPPAAASAPQQ